MAVHPHSAGVEQDCPERSVADGPVDGASHGGGERDEDDPGALAHHAQHAVAVSLAEVVDVGAEVASKIRSQGGRAWRQGEVVGVRGAPCPAAPTCASSPINRSMKSSPNSLGRTCPWKKARSSAPARPDPSTAPIYATRTATCVRQPALNRRTPMRRTRLARHYAVPR